MHFIWHVVVEYKHLLSWTYASKSHETQKIASAKWHKFARCFLCPSTIVLENDAKCLSLQYIIKISLLVHVCLEVGQTKKKNLKSLLLQWIYSILTLVLLSSKAPFPSRPKRRSSSAWKRKQMRRVLYISCFGLKWCKTLLCCDLR